MGIVTTDMSAVSFSVVSTPIFAVQGSLDMLRSSQIKTVFGKSFCSCSRGKIARSRCTRSVEPRFGPPCEPLKASFAALAALPAEKQTLKRLAELHVRHCDEHGRA